MCNAEYLKKRYTKRYTKCAKKFYFEGIGSSDPHVQKTLILQGFQVEKSFIFYCEKSKNYRKEIDFLGKNREGCYNKKRKK